MPNHTVPSSDPSTDNRRASRRVSAEEVPWIRAVKPNAAESARLIDISPTGLLVETDQRLLPGRRSSIVIVSEDNRREKLEAVVVRSQLVGLGPTGEPIYRTALMFSRPLELRLPEESVDAARPTLDGPGLDGPFSAVWTTDDGQASVVVTTVAESGCFVATPASVAVDQLTTLTVWFSETRYLQLTGRISGVDAGEGCLVRFENLSQEVRRALRLEIQGAALARPVEGSRVVRPRLSAHESPLPLGNLLIDWSAQSAGQHANHW